MIPVLAYRGREIAVLGLGRTGCPSVRALVAGGAIVRAWDDNPATRARAEAEGIATDDFTRRDWQNLAAIVISPGIAAHGPLTHKIVQQARQLGVRVIGDIELFAQVVRAINPSEQPKVIAITGTNGKSTTTALVGHILREAGRDAQIGGNFGISVLDLPKIHRGAHYVLELSSYQLETTETLRPNAAALLNITPDHLERHGTMASYADTKMRIFQRMGSGDVAVIGTDDPYCQARCTYLKLHSPARVVPISASGALGQGVSAVGGRLWQKEQKVPGGPTFDLSLASALPGRHNAQNIAAAYALCRAVGLKHQDVCDGLRTFPGLAHRLERIASVEGVRFINDSKATNADAARQALATFPRVRWILGGQAKEGGIDSLTDLFARVAKAYLIGDAATEFARKLEGHCPHQQAGTVERAVEQAFADARASGEADPIVLFSPACASFDQFTDFEHRGDTFRKAVLDLQQARAAAEADMAGGLQ